MRTDPAEPAQDLGHVRPEHAAVGVALVHDHAGQAPEEAVPAGVPRQQRMVQHVRGGEQVARVRPGPGPLAVRRVTVDHGRADARHAERGQHAQLVGGQRPGRRQVQHGAAVQHAGQRRQQIAERLARGRPGRDDYVPARRRVAGRGGLVRPGPGHSRRLERLGHLGRGPARPADALPLGGGQVFQVGQLARPRALGQDPGRAWGDRELSSGEQRHRRHRISVCHLQARCLELRFWYRHDFRA